MTLEEVLHYLKSILEIPTDINTEQSTSLQLREPILDSIYSVGERLRYLLGMCCQWVKLWKVRLYATLNLQLEIRDHIQDALEHMQQL
jgi:hypothetical protein